MLRNESRIYKEGLKFWIIAIMAYKDSVAKLGIDLALKLIWRPFQRGRWRMNKTKLRTRIKGGIILIRGNSDTWRRWGRLRCRLTWWGPRRTVGRLSKWEVGNISLNKIELVNDCLLFKSCFIGHQEAPNINNRRSISAILFGSNKHIIFISKPLQNITKMISIKQWFTNGREFISNIFNLSQTVRDVETILSDFLKMTTKTMIRAVEEDSYTIRWASKYQRQLHIPRFHPSYHE